jgi:hypothetical protein
MDIKQIEEEPKGWWERVFGGYPEECYRVEGYQHPVDAVRLCRWIERLPCGVNNRVTINGRTITFNEECSKEAWIEAFLVGADWSMGLLKAFDPITYDKF